jgi:hypothetical protein
MINGLIAQFEKVSLIGIINPDPASPIPLGEDCLAYWDDNEHICWGRYLQLKNIHGTDIEFWTGLSTIRQKAEFIIWFKKENLSDEYRKQLKDVFPTDQYNESATEVWITMPGNDSEDFCKSTPHRSRSAIIKDFWASVLRILN